MMQQRKNDRRIQNILLERIVWNVAAATALAAMIVLLLCSLQWLDSIGANAHSMSSNIERSSRHETQTKKQSRPARVAQVNRPSG